MLTNKQKGIIHIYKNAAQLEDEIYRNLLMRVAQVKSSAAKSFTNAQFDELMRRLETILHYRVLNDMVPMPCRTKIQSLTYWRDRCPNRNAATTRQFKEIQELWSELLPMLPPENQNAQYLLAITGHAINQQVNQITELKLMQANMLIEALKDRLHYARKKQDQPVQEVMF